uniref:Uncharacterized protein n=1 Tax=Oryza meridionalis TaxID=40149 RepID=A0A0E0BZB8_9ORYZ
MTPSNELVVPRYEGDVPPLQDDFTPYLYLNGANLSIFEDTNELFLENKLDTKGVIVALKTSLTLASSQTH